LTYLSPAKAAVLFHVVQEGLSNVSKHSDAAEARVHIVCSAAACNVRVVDNGKGFDKAAIDERWDVPHGLALLKQRVEALGGSFDIDTSEGKGTAIAVQMSH